MLDDLPIALSGAPGSPYTRKMVSLLRYRRIAYRLLPPSGPALAGLPTAKVALLPTFYLPGPSGDLEAVTDSSPILRRLERDRPGRSAIPSDPALAFIDSLIEDYADEWLTKAMFHYRWAYQDDIDKAGAILPCWRGFSIPDDVLAERSEMIRSRQIGRLYVVGSNEVTGPLIEASYVRFLEAFEEVLRHQPFIMGGRPGASDFGVYGQLTQLAGFDPTPSALTLKVAPRVSAWTGMMEDQSGLEPKDGDWLDIRNPPPALLGLLREIGRVYPPVMLANAAAGSAGQPTFETTVEGQRWTQPTFPYQIKCLQWLRADRADLPADARETVDGLLRQTGCDALFV